MISDIVATAAGDRCSRHVNGRRSVPGRRLDRYWSTLWRIAAVLCCAPDVRLYRIIEGASDGTVSKICNWGGDLGAGARRHSVRGGSGAGRVRQLQFVDVVRQSLCELHGLQRSGSCPGGLFVRSRSVFAVGRFGFVVPVDGPVPVGYSRGNHRDSLTRSHENAVRFRRCGRAGIDPHRRNRPSRPGVS